MIMPRLVLPSPLTSIVPVLKEPVPEDRILPAEVSIARPMAESTPVLEIYPLLSTKLLEFKVTAAVELVWIAILPPESMVKSPLLAVVSAVLVPLDISVAACADTMTAPATRTNETAQSIRRRINQP